jgi:hypothetical protein
LSFVDDFEKRLFNRSQKFCFLTLKSVDAATAGAPGKILKDSIAEVWITEIARIAFWPIARLSKTFRSSKKNGDRQ